VAGVALGDIDGAFVCFCVTGVVLTGLGWLWWRALSPAFGDIDGAFVWHAWRLLLE